MNISQTTDLIEEAIKSGDINLLSAGYSALTAEHTTPLGLNQWSLSDKPTMEDFNRDNERIDKKLRELLSELATQVSIVNGTYEGKDLTIKFGEEIAASPYHGNPWAWIKARIIAGNYAGICISDYIPFTAGGNNIKAEVAGINTYKGYGDIEVGNHIDFISRDCWPEAHAFNRVNYNNGTSVSPSPWLASDLYAWLNSVQSDVPNAVTAHPALVSVDYTTTGVYDKLPTTLKDVIVTKRLIMPSRYKAGTLLTDDISWAWGDAGKLWLPSEMEVYGTSMWGTTTQPLQGYDGGGYVQYPIFAQNMKRSKGAEDGGARSSWWLSTASGGYSTYCARVYYTGNADIYSASYTSILAPLCFRVA